MSFTFSRPLSVLVLALALVAPAAAVADGDITAQLDAQRVTVVDGKETFSPATQAKPGELVEYRATYTNAGGQTARQVLATLPVPAGMEFVDHTAVPAKVEASLDGRTYAPVPLKRPVRLANGREVVRLVPAAEYRWLRWPLAAMEPGSVRTVSARMRVRSVPLTAATR